MTSECHFEYLIYLKNLSLREYTRIISIPFLDNQLVKIGQCFIQVLILLTWNI